MGLCLCFFFIDDVALYRMPNLEISDEPLIFPLNSRGVLMMRERNPRISYEKRGIYIGSEDEGP